MGLLDQLLSKAGLGASEPSAQKPGLFSISSTFRPVRLKSRSENSCDLVLKVSNQTPSEHMCSIVVELPKALGFDGVGLHKTKELRLGAFGTGAHKELTVPIWANNQTPSGTYRVFITVYSHYRDYSHVLNSSRKMVELRVV